MIPDVATSGLIEPLLESPDEYPTYETLLENHLGGLDSGVSSA
jgi:hypothetical protein